MDKEIDIAMAQDGIKQLEAEVYWKAKVLSMIKERRKAPIDKDLQDTLDKYKASYEWALAKKSIDKIKPIPKAKKIKQEKEPWD